MTNDGIHAIGLALAMISVSLLMASVLGTQLNIISKHPPLQRECYYDLFNVITICYLLWYLVQH